MFSFTTLAKFCLYTYVGNKDGVISVTFMIRDIRIFSEIIVILWGQRISRMGFDDEDDDDDDDDDDDYDNDNDNDADYVW
jgi:phosphopantothenoylcysteine synthetase/decarboxylase